MKALSFTGPRPGKLGGFHGARAIVIQNNIRDRLVNVIIRAYNNGFDTFISGGALGVDQLAAAAVIHCRDELKLPIRLIIAMPFPSQAKAWPKHAQDYFHKLCDQADEVVIVSDDPYTREKMQARNEWMVNESYASCAVWGGGGGGTGNCVKYIRSEYKPVLIINPYTLVEKWELPGKVRW